MSLSRVFTYFLRVSVSVSKKFGIEKSLSLSLKNFGLKKVSVLVSKKLVSKKRLSFSLDANSGLAI